jgi:hypothetical protein
VGVYLAADAIASLFVLPGSFMFGPTVEGWPSAREIFTMTVLGLLGTGLVAVLLLTEGDYLAERLFKDTGVNLTGLTRRDLILSGVRLFGVYYLVRGLPVLVELAAKAVYYAKGPRQGLLLGALEQMRSKIGEATVTVVVGGLVVGLAPRIAARLERSRR